jgi:hypothetical protein
LGCFSKGVEFGYFGWSTNGGVRLAGISSSHWNDSFGATDRVSSIDLSKFYSSGDPPFRGVSPSPVFTAVV